MFDLMTLSSKSRANSFNNESGDLVRSYYSSVKISCESLIREPFPRVHRNNSLS